MRNLTLSLVMVVLVATIGLGWMFDVIYNHFQQDTPSENHDSISVIEQFGGQLAKALAKVDDRQNLIKHWPQQGQFTLTLASIEQFPMPQALLTEVTSGKALLLETDESIALHFYLPNSNEILRVATPQIVSNDNNVLLPIIFTSLFYIAVLLLVLVWLYPLICRLMALRQSAKAFGEGKLDERITVGSISYIRDIELEFNRMAQRIDDLVNDIKLLSSAVSHDLRTPLARIRFGIDTIQEEDDPVLRKRFEQRISDNVDEMVELVEMLLSYARLDQTLITLNKAPVDLPALVASCIDNKSQDDVELQFTHPENIEQVYGDLSYLMVLVSNLLQNAYQYCQGNIRVTLSTTDDYVQLCVEDDGPGIALEQREKIIKPFIRGEDSEHKVKGYGMGLAIVNRVVQWHQGRLEISESKQLQGAQFTVLLPKVNTP